MLNYYNEIDPFAAQWLRNLIDAELIPYGIVDTRDIRDVQPSDLAGFTQCHFFAGIGLRGSARRKIERVRQRDRASNSGGIYSNLSVDSPSMS